MEEFLDNASSRLPTLRGLKYTDTDLFEFGRCVTNQGEKYQIIYGSDQVNMIVEKYQSRQSYVYVSMDLSLRTQPGSMSQMLRSRRVSSVKSRVIFNIL